MTVWEDPTPGRFPWLVRVACSSREGTNVEDLLRWAWTHLGPRGDRWNVTHAVRDGQLITTFRLATEEDHALAVLAWL